MSCSSDALPLLYNGDAFVLTLQPEGHHRVRLVSVVRYPDNVDGDGVHEQFRDLDPETKQRVIQQINRRYQGKTVLT
jgi:hypothetical protein